MIRIDPRLFVVTAVLGLSLLGGCSSERAPAAGPLPNAHELASPKRTTRAELAAHRKLQIERLHAYTIAGKFPENPSPSPEPIHMFRDAKGNLCPIANLIFADGHEALVDRMVKEHNDVVVADETSGPLHEWVLTSGLTNEEVRRIQGVGFPGEGRFVPGGGIAPSALARIELIAHLQTVEKELVDATDTSLDVAMRRLDALVAPTAEAPI